MGNGTRIALAAIAGVALFGAIVLAVPPRGAPDAAPSPVAAPWAAPEPAEPASAAPRFDTVRVEADGRGLVAGRAAPGELVSVMVGTEVAADATADDDGRFVAFLDLAPSDLPREVTLRSGADGAASDASVILAPVPVAAATDLAADPVPTAAAVAAPAAPATEEVPSALPAEPAAQTETPRARLPGPAEAGPGPTLPVQDAALADREGNEGPAAAAAPVVTEAPAPNATATPPTEPLTGESMPTRAAEDDLTVSALDAEVDSAEALSVPSLTPGITTLQGPASVTAAPTAPPSPEAGRTLVIAEAPQPASTPSAEAGAETPPAPFAASDQPALDAPAAEAPAQAPVLLSDASGVRVLQPALAPGSDPEVLATVALDAIAYDGAGAVVLSGRATGAGMVRLYLDNQAVAEAPVGADGTWETALAETPPGVYVLRVDQLAPDGAVASRIETPFQREERAALAAAMAEAAVAGQAIAVRTVQPGNTLWAIARDRYGEPMMYLRVFELNRDRIRDPDLIFPGQVFVLPATAGR